MFRASLAGLDRKRLRLWLTLFFLALAVPTGILIHQAYSQLKWEAFHQHRMLAEELAARIDGRFIQLINDEEARSFTDYAFLVVAGDPSANFVQRSPLSAYPVASAIPGLIGYFQVDPQGTLSTPLLPQAGAGSRTYGIPADELEQRLALQDRIQQILGQNRLVKGDKATVAGGKASLPEAHRRRSKQEELHALNATAEKHAGEPVRDETAVAPAEEQGLAQAAFDRLNEAGGGREPKKKQQVVSRFGRVEDLKLDYSYQAEPAAAKQPQISSQSAALLDKRGVRKERSALPEPQAPVRAEQPGAEARIQSEIRIRTFESEIDPFEFSLLDSGHFVLFRQAWRDEQRYIQGALIEQQPFLQGMIKSAFGETALSNMSDLIVAHQGNVFSAFTGQASQRYVSSAEELSGALLYQARLSAPLSDLELIFSITRLPLGPGDTVITWIASILTVVLCGGFYLMYRLGVGQIDLTRQQQDFVSAVSHELKTPLTSIRMYGEMLREGWASEEKKKIYYDYIYDESERLSRLISNVLQLARMTRNDLRVDLKPMTVAELMDGIRSKVSSQIERAGFELNLNCEDEAAVIQVDADNFIQIIINLVDNAIKFSDKAEMKVIDIACHLRHDGTVLFTIRDYGPGVPRDQVKKIFKLFYRSENELTRETVGTGIGLALVHQLALTMDGQVDVVNRDPGAEFRMSFSALDENSIP